MSKFALGRLLANINCSISDPCKISDLTNNITIGINRWKVGTKRKHSMFNKLSDLNLEEKTVVNICALIDRKYSNLKKETKDFFLLTSTKDTCPELFSASVTPAEKSVKQMLLRKKRKLSTPAYTFDATKK